MSYEDIKTQVVELDTFFYVDISQVLNPTESWVLAWEKHRAHHLNLLMGLMFLVEVDNPQIIKSSDAKQIIVVRF